MSNDQPKETRRWFIKRTSVAMGALAGGAAMLAPRRTWGLQPVDPNNYPWSVEVGSQGIISLYLVQEYRSGGVDVPALTLRNLLYQNLELTLGHMIGKLDSAIAASDPTDRDKLYAALNFPLALLRTRLDAARTAVQANTDQLTFMDYAMVQPGYWDAGHNNAVYQPLAYISTLMCVPIMECDRSKAHMFHRACATAVDSTYNTRAVKSLFIDTQGVVGVEVPIWQAARDAGLLWCTPYPSLRSIRPNFVPPDQEFLPSGEMNIMVNGNDKRCGTDNKCSVDAPGYYCQIVNNECNAMSS